MVGITALTTLLLASVIHGDIKESYKPYTYIEDDLPTLAPNKAWWKDHRVKPYWVFLCLDGGGMRGIVPTMVLIEVEKQIKQFILSNLDDFDLVDAPPDRTKDDYNFNTVNDFHIYLADFFDGVSGISAGSWVTSYIVTKGGYGTSRQVLQMPSIVNKYGSHRAGSLQGLRVFFLEYGARVYPPPRIPFTFKQRFWATPTMNVKLITEPMYHPAGLEWVLKTFLGDTKLSEVATSTLIVAFDLYRMSAIEFIADYIDIEGGKPDIYTGVCITRSTVHNQATASNVDPPKHKATRMERRAEKRYESMERINDLDYFIRDIARASSAFPMIHPSKLVKPLNDITNYFDMIDGAMVGNNPTLPMLAWAMTHNKIDTINQTAFLSIGTGFAEGSYTDIGDGGIIQWQAPIIELVTGSTPEYIQSLMDYAFYGNALNTRLHIVQNQLLRIQLVKASDTPEGELIAGVTQDQTGIEKMEEMAELLAAQYRDNIAIFVRDFMMKYSRPEFPPMPNT